MATRDPRPELLAIAERASAYAQERGAQQVAAHASMGRQARVVLRDGSQEEVKASVSRGLSLSLYVDGRYGTHSTSEVDAARVEEFIDRALEMTRVLMPDEHRALPDPAHYEGRSQVDLQLFDENFDASRPDDRYERARRAHDTARDHVGDTLLSVGATASDSASYSASVNTNGFSDSERRTSYSVSCSVTVKDPSGRRPSEWAEDASRHAPAERLDPESIGRKAAERTLATVGSTDIPSTTLPVIVESRTIGTLLGGLLGPLSGGAIDQKRSCFADALNTSVANAKLSLHDRPLLPGAWGSRRYNGEGLTLRPRPILEQGVLRTFFVDCYYGRKLGWQPSPGWSNLFADLGSEDVDGLCREAGDAILITGFLGGNSNSTTGDFSHGIMGFLIEGGKRTQPIASMNIAGNHTELWHRIRALGNDPYPHSALQVPSLLFEPMVVAGR